MLFKYYIHIISIAWRMYGKRDWKKDPMKNPESCSHQLSWGSGLSPNENGIEKEGNHNDTCKLLSNIEHPLLYVTHKAIPLE